MCNDEKKVFAQTIGKAKSTMLTVARTDVVRRAVGEISDELANRANKYSGMVNEYVAGGDSSSPSSGELSSIKEESSKLYTQYKSSEQFVKKAKQAANVKKAMLLQIGQ